MGNGYSFAHAIYGASPEEKHIFRDLFFDLVGKVPLGLSALRALTVGPSYGSSQTSPPDLRF